MIIINLKGGLGNQIFQYATGRALSLRQKDQNGSATQLKLDVAGYGEHNGIDTMRHYSLSTFNIKADIATPEEIRASKYPYGIISKGLRFVRAKSFHQYNIGFNEEIFATKRKDLYLDGFFQTQKYFMDKEQQIRNDLKIIVPFSAKTLNMSGLINKTDHSVSLHVRRGDYVSDLNTNQYHGTCDADYYSKAIEYITSKIGTGIHLFVFSDDIDWVMENMLFQYPTTYVSSPLIPDYEEMYLMSLCNHHIIANSSFSWWGAWLDKKSDKIVIAPKRWTQKDERNYRDIIPNSWIRL